MDRYTGIYRGETAPTRTDVLWVHHKIKNDLKSPTIVEAFQKGQWRQISEDDVSGKSTSIEVDILPSASEETIGYIYSVPKGDETGEDQNIEYVTIKNSDNTYRWERVGGGDGESLENIEVFVDNTTGNPTGTATYSDGTLTLSFSGLKGQDGQQGNTGSSVDYPYELVNNLTTDDATKGLSAAQGVVLDGKVSQLQLEVVSVVAKDVGTQYKSVYVGNDTSIGAIGDIIDDASTNSFAVELPLPTGAKSVTFYGRKWSSGARGYAFLASDNSVLSYGGFSASADITIDVPSGSAKVRLSLYTGHKDVTITSEVRRTDILDDVDGAVGYTIGLDSARLVIRARPSTTITTDTPDGTRIRIVFQVSAGMKLYAHTTDTNGLSVGVWDTLKNAVQASSNAGVVQAPIGFTTDWIEYEINANGFLLLSLKSDVAISDARKQEMIDSISFVLGTGLQYEVGKQALVDEDAESRLEAIENPELPYAYYGEKINLGGFDWFVFAKNSLGAQSSTRYGDYLFSVQDKLAKIICYNLRTKELLYQLTPGISAEDYWHCNQCSFSTKFYADGDMFPVLYVSTQNDPNGVCYALGFRIIPVLTDGEISSFSVTLVQTIQFPAMTEDNCLGNVNTVFDTQRGYMWTYSRNKDSSAANFNKARFTKWAIPELTNSLVQLTDADILDAFSDDWSMFNAQGGFIRNGKLVMMQGYESAGYINCRVIDLYLSKKQTSLIDLLAIAFPYEPEGCFYWDGMIMTQTSGVTIVGIRFS